MNIKHLLLLFPALLLTGCVDVDNCSYMGLIGNSMVGGQSTVYPASILTLIFMLGCVTLFFLLFYAWKKHIIKPELKKQAIDGFIVCHIMCVMLITLNFIIADLEYQDVLQHPETIVARLDDGGILYKTKDDPKPIISAECHQNNTTAKYIAWGFMNKHN